LYGNFWPKRALWSTEPHGVHESPRGNLRHGETAAGDLLMAVILIVEDEMFIRDAAGWMIEDLGHNPLLAADLAGALELISTHGPIDGLFVDLRLRDLIFGGFDVANQAVRIQPGLPVLYTSGRALTGEMTSLMVEGGQFLQKPYSAAQLELSVANLLH
jgi:DNA-binding NtrC family response regulator